MSLSTVKITQLTPAVTLNAGDLFVIANKTNTGSPETHSLSAQLIYNFIANQNVLNFLPISGGNLTGPLFAPEAVFTSLTASSATINIINITNYELSGFNVTGNVTVNGNISSSGIIFAFNGDSDQWNSTYTIVHANSASWEESADILPTVTNYLSTNNVRLSSATITDTLSISSVQIRTRGTSNVFIGNATTGRNAATGNHNFVFGLSAGNALTDGSNNVFIGACAGRVNCCGNSNNFLGSDAGRSNTTGNSNNFLGYRAGFSNTTGGSNNFLGSAAGFSNTTGGSNNFLGTSTGFYNTTGSSNNFFGNAAGLSNTTGNSNNFLGNGAGFSNTTGCFNNFFGDSAGRNNTTGGNNNFFGNNAGRGASYYDFSSYTIKGCARGFNNNFFGQSAGVNIDSGRHNNFFGTNAGCTNTIGWNNTIIGNAANVATNSLSGVIVLGTGAIATESHQIVLSTANVSFKNTGDTFEVGNNALPNNLTVFGDISASQYLNFTTGKTIHVDSVKGTDTRTDLSKYDIGRPFATIAAAAAASVTGDLVYVRAGTYTITSQINLDGEGNMFFETGATVQVFPGVVAFSFSQTALPINAISIRGNADFQLLGTTAGVLTMPSGNATTAVQFECNSISGPNSVTGTLFNCAIGVLSVDAKLIQMTTNFAGSNATVFNITGTGNVTTRIPFVYCGVFLNGAGAANPGSPLGALARFNCDVWTLATFNTTAGMNLNLITTNFRIVNYNHAGGVLFNFIEDSTIEGHVFNGVRWDSGLGLPNMSFASSAGAATQKVFNLRESNVFKGSLTNSLSASVPVNVWVQSSYATVSASANVTFKVGSFTVDPLVGNM